VITAIKNSKLRTGAGVTIKRLFLLTSLSIFIPASLLMAQSVADAAKTERERRERVKGQGKVFTDSDLKSTSERSNVSTGTVGKRINTPPSQGTVAIPVQRAGSAMIVSAELNSRLKANLVVDTGASYIAISKPVAASLGLTTTEHTRFIPLQTANGVRMAPIMKLSSFRLGAIEVNDVEATIIDDWSDSNVVGVLGMNFLSAFDWSTDNANGQLLLKRLVDVYGGYGKDWWIERFRTLRTSIDALKTQLKLAENLGDGNRISQTKDVLNRFQAEMDLLTRGADEAGLPVEYRN
jgi:clan AA aspartic protease (TIGR02281 family)